MVAKVKAKSHLILGLLLILVISSNYAIYRIPIVPPPSEAGGVVLGSLIDFAIIGPLLVLAITRKKGFSIKRIITFIVLGLIAAKFIIPASYFEPYKWVPIAALGVEGIIILAEIGMVALLVMKLPSIIRIIKENQLPLLFALPKLIKEKVSDYWIVRMLATDVLILYYSFGSWKQKVIHNEQTFTIHKNTSFVAFYVMLLHAIVIETIGIHWWLHDVSLILSIVLLLLNIYSVLYVLAEIQAVRLNPIRMENEALYLSLGIGKRMMVSYDCIEKVQWGNEAAACNLKSKDLLDFLARDLESVEPQCVIHFKTPQKATVFFGMEKEYTQVALRVDELARFEEALREKIAKE